MTLLGITGSAASTGLIETMRAICFSAKEMNGLDSAINRCDRLGEVGGEAVEESGVSSLLFQRGSSCREFLTLGDLGSNVTFLSALLTLRFRF